MKKDTREIRNKKWANRSLISGIVSLFFSLCTVPVSGIPLGLPFGIFAIAFALISKDKDIRGNAVAGIIIGSIGIALSLLLYALILFVLSSIRDPRIANNIPPEQLKYLQDFIQTYILR